MTYEEELLNHIDYLKQALKNLSGVSDGFIIRNRSGDVVSRVGRISLNPPWYTEFYKQYRRRPTNIDLAELAKDHLQYGYWDIGGFIPALKDRN